MGLTVYFAMLIWPDYNFACPEPRVTLLEEFQARLPV